MLLILGTTSLQICTLQGMAGRRDTQGSLDSLTSMAFLKLPMRMLQLISGKLETSLTALTWCRLSHALVDLPVLCTTCAAQ